MEKEFEEESKKLKTQILKDVELYLVKYRDLAMLATEEAKRQQKKAELVKLKTRELTELTCKSFEKKLRTKMQEDLKKYEEATQSAYSKMIMREKSMNIKWTEREKLIEREKKDFEKSILKQAERRIEEFRSGLMTTQAQLTKEREIFEDMMGNLKERVSFELTQVSFQDYLTQITRLLLSVPSLKKKCITGLLLHLVWMKRKFQGRCKATITRWRRKTWAD